VAIESKFNSTVDRLVAKMGLSQARVPGFIMGLSGTDSTVAFLLTKAALAKMGMADRLLGIHYVHPERRRKGWFEEHMIPWLRAAAPSATILVESALGGNNDQQRWGDLHTRALHPIIDGKPGPLYAEGENYWLCGTVNATEKALGTYSMLANAVSVQLVQTFWKSEIIALCEHLGVPEIAVENARLPDCLCGRDEIASANIEVIDQILRSTIRPSAHDPVLLDTLYDYIADTRRVNGFKQRIPYLL
jgi:NH3-dependent NAD+ synthetase